MKSKPTNTKSLTPVWTIQDVLDIWRPGLQARITKANDAQIEVSAYYSILDGLIRDIVGKPKVDDVVIGVAIENSEATEDLSNPPSSTLKERGNNEY